jgi:hypothetical protein
MKKKMQKSRQPFQPSIAAFKNHKEKAVSRR